jgi:glycosyltransferase involved in cell wall biosynthesis
MNVAIVHDYLNQYGGAERVLEALHDLYPQAPVYTSVYAPAALPAAYQQWDIRTSFMQRLPFVTRRHQIYFPLYATAFERFDFSAYDLIISSSSAWAKGVITPPHALHICYCHTPMRFAWSTQEYLRGENVGRLGRFFLPFALSYVRLWDELSSMRVDEYIANSQETARRIGKYYRRPATVINPPVDLSGFRPAEGPPDDYFLVVARLVPYKRLDAVIEAFNILGLPLRVVGKGRQRAQLEALARDNIRFLGGVSHEELGRLYANCRALLWPEAADFGITPVEAQAAGRPVIAYAAGGALETIIPGETGVFFDQQTPEAIVAAVRAFDADRFDSARIRRHAEQYDVSVFKRRMRDLITTCWASWQEQRGPRRPRAFPVERVFAETDGAREAQAVASDQWALPVTSDQ